MSGIFRRGKAVKKPGVHLLIQRIIELSGQLIDIAKPQIQRHPPAVQQQTMAAAKAEATAPAAVLPTAPAPASAGAPGGDRPPSAEIFQN
jgi:hypothetical protein